MIDFDEACRRTAALARPLGVETAPLAEAAGRVLAGPVRAWRAAPPTDVAAMDGYAVRDADVAGGSSRLRIAGETFAGDAATHLPPERGACFRVFTGAPVPSWADRVVVQEVVRRDGDLAILDGAPGEARHIRRAASDFRPGEVLVEPGTTMTPQAMIAAAAADIAALQVFRRPRVVILSTGDELAEPGCAHRRPGAIPESVSFGVAAMVEAWGGVAVARRRLADDLTALVAAAGAALDEAEVVVTTGGASVGARDHAKAMFAPLGLELAFEKVAMKPGKPVWLGRVGPRLVLGLPGNPSAALVTARLFLAPLLAGLGGRSPQAAWDWRSAPIAGPLGACADRDLFCRARSTPAGALPHADQDSSGQKALAAADLLIRRRPGAPALATGDLAEILAI